MSKILQIICSLFIDFWRSFAVICFLYYTVTRPYAGFRHPDRMAPDQTVRGGENDCFIWSGNFLAQVPKFSSIFRNPGIFLRFTWSSVRRVPFLCWYFTFLPEDISGIFRRFTMWRNESVRRVGLKVGSKCYYSTVNTSTSTPQLPYRNA